MGKNMKQHEENQTQNLKKKKGKGLFLITTAPLPQ